MCALHLSPCFPTQERFADGSSKEIRVNRIRVKIIKFSLDLFFLVCCVCVCDKNWVLTRVTYGWYQHWIMITIKVDDRKILFVSHDKITKIKWKWNLVWIELLVCCVCVCDETWVLTSVMWLVSLLNYDHDNSWWWEKYCSCHMTKSPK